MTTTTATDDVAADSPVQPGSTSIDDAEAPGWDPVIEGIVEAFEPVLAAQRRVIAAIWQDRSISKLNMHVLMLLEAHGPQSMSRLAALANVALPNLTGMVGRMHELGLVVREADPGDRRVVVVHASAKGHACIQELQAVRRDELRRILHTLSPDERERCLDAMRTMARAATALLPEPEPIR